MKKRFLVCSVILALTSINTANAENAKALSPNHKHIDLKEIVLEEGQLYETPNEKVAVVDAPIIVEDTSKLEPSLENRQDVKPDENKGFFNIFNLKGGVEKSTPEIEAEVEETAVGRWIHGDYATGQWLGVRPILEDHGVTINSSLLYSPFAKTRGGMNEGRAGRGYSLFNLSVTVDTEKAGLWKGGTFYALYQRKKGFGLSSEAMGDWMVLDGWDFREMNQLSEAWYQQMFFKDKLRLKFGKQDGNTDFCALNSGFDFTNTAHSINPTVPLPTYPDQAFGFMAEISPKEWISIKNGIYSRFNVPFNITEIELKPTIKNLPGRYMVGAWELSDSNGMEAAAGIDGGGETYYNNFNRNFGAYAGFEQMVYKENKKDTEDMQGLTVFAQYGISPSNRNDMSQYVGGGLHYRGPIKNRDQDILGLAVANGSFAQRLGYITNQVGSETSIEAFYKYQVNPWFYLQPDVQFIMNPGGCYDNSVAIGLRSVITF